MNDNAAPHNGKLPRGWATAHLNDIGVLHCGQSPPSASVNDHGEGTPYISGPEQWDGSALRIDKWTTVAKRVVPEASVFVTVKGAGVGTVFPGVQAAIGRDIYAYTPEPDVSSAFITHVLRFTATEVVRRAQGDIPGLSKDHILNHRIPLPPHAEQRRIAEALDELFCDLDDGVGSLERARAKLARYRAAVLKAAVEGALTPEWRRQHPDVEGASELLRRILAERRARWEGHQLRRFTEKSQQPPKDWQANYKKPIAPDITALPLLPESWCWATIAQLAAAEKNSITDGPFGSELKTEHYTESGPRVIRLQNIKDGNFADERAHISEARFSMLQKHRVYPGDLVIAALGEHLPRACVIPDEIGQAIVKADCIRFRPSPLLSAFCVNYFLNSLPTRTRTKRLVHGVGRPRMNLDEIRSVILPVAPSSEQEAIVEAVEDQLSVIEHVESQIDATLVGTHALRQSILRHAFTGQLVPQDPNDEPASELLKRIAAEREARAQEAAAAKPAFRAPKKKTAKVT